MDLLSAARYLGRPFVFTDAGSFDALPLGARALIGDGFTAALVAADGAIDWLCMPRFDSPSVFARILDNERGGSMAVRPARFPFQSLQQYDPDTNVLETLFYKNDVLGGGAVRVVDSMPWSNDPRALIHEIHRRVDCPDGEAEIEIVFDPRFDYARDTPKLAVAEHGVLAISEKGEHFALSTSEKLTWTMLPNGGARATYTLRPGVQLWCILAWDTDHVARTAAHRPFEQLRVTRAAWRAWSSKLTYDGPWRHQVLRSALLLKLLMYAPTGAVVAAPTTSLPEWPGGTRNWDYRFTWARDSAMAIRSANLLGFGSEAREFYHFVRDAVDHVAGLQLMYTIDGRPVPNEEELAHLAGTYGSRPVRIGNAARDQVQLDTTGAIVDAAQLYERFGGTLTLEAWRTIAAVIERAEQTWNQPDHGIWEPRNGYRHNVHSKLMNWLAMDRGAQIASTFGRDDLVARWTSLAEVIRADVCAKGMDPTHTHFVASYGETRPDAALLQLAIHGFLPDGDPRLKATVDWVRERLSVGPYLYRYHDDDGVGGPEGAFILCGFWLAEALALQGRLDEAAAVFKAHADGANHAGLLSEEISPDGKQLLGNFPQAFSHLGLINAALRIDLAYRLRNEGSLRSPHLVGSLAEKAKRRE